MSFSEPCPGSTVSPNKYLLRLHPRNVLTLVRCKEENSNLLPAHESGQKEGQITRQCYKQCTIMGVMQVPVTKPPSIPELQSLRQWAGSMPGATVGFGLLNHDGWSHKEANKISGIHSFAWCPGNSLISPKTWLPSSVIAESSQSPPHRLTIKWETDPRSSHKGLEDRHVRGSGELAQWVRCSLHKCEELGSDPQDIWKSHVVW